MKASAYPVERIWIHVPPQRSALDEGYWFPESPYVYLHRLIHRVNEQQQWAKPFLRERLFSWFGVGRERRAKAQASVREMLACARPLRDGDLDGYIAFVMDDLREMKRVHVPRELEGVDDDTIKRMAAAVFADPPERYEPDGEEFMRLLRAGVLPRI